MKRALSLPAPDEPAKKRDRIVERCAICRGPQSDCCGECNASGEDRACLGTITSPVCHHTYHMECIQRWLRVRPCCPLCNATWVFPHGLSLQELAAVQFIDNEKKIVELVGLDMDPKVYQALDSGGLCANVFGNRGTTLSSPQRRLLAHKFGKYLEIAELEELIRVKKIVAKQ